MHKVETFCDCCGAQRPDRERFIELARAGVLMQWWAIEDLGHPQRTGRLDFCSLKCVHAFTGDPDVHAKYPEDFGLPPRVVPDGQLVQDGAK